VARWSLLYAASCEYVLSNARKLITRVGVGGFFSSFDF